ncbi:glycosyltransferase family 4 protein [Domibacillus sp. DTU_2020_1001157_1_SI_ALB_TIR_016]|uniref:glycosyltransferase family 4 protein n=1 Tax=Domibacillus sp. DTU_2020_1001157_1_SI_ALB_TIR_016 TaxID=3077789 RepID=UPI0028E79DEB|nr:glycosyltransferase family 4 protein [Domibacillus sp. DTU_2020_1001157_1_SI_ALB_TIR_016]WNS81211.1 glycosyltransferase family 4 protein [Domibacillus sp. DTU_2020_1001157_1_SI_ALB_TIR_016]
MREQSVRPKAAFVASVYRHLAAFHIPYMKWFQLNGFDVHAYALPDHGKEEVERIGVVCHDIPFQRSPFQADNLRALKQLTDSFQEESFQVVHVHTPVASVLGRIAAKRSSVPTVLYTAHGFHFFKGAPLKNWLTFYPVERIMAKYTDYLITMNDEDFTRAKRFPVKQEVLFVKGVGVDRSGFSSQSEQRRQETRGKLGISDDGFVIACVAELSARKNQVQLLEALHQLNTSVPVTCLLVGNGEAEEDLKAIVKRDGLSERVQFLGFRKDIPELIEAADAITLLSKQEGLPRALMEGLAAGKPIITTNVRGNRDLVIHGENGYVVELGNVKETVWALEQLISRPDERKKMGMKSRELSCQYDEAFILKEMSHLYEKATQRVAYGVGQEEIG